MRRSGFTHFLNCFHTESMSVRRNSALDSEVDSVLDDNDMLDNNDGPELYVPPPSLLRGSISADNGSTRCVLFGKSFPRTEVRYFAQIFILYIVIFTCLGNLSAGKGELTSFWIALLSSSVGLISPSPHISRSAAQSAPRMSNIP